VICIEVGGLAAEDVWRIGTVVVVAAEAVAGSIPAAVDRRFDTVATVDAAVVVVAADLSMLSEVLIVLDIDAAAAGKTAEHTAAVAVVVAAAAAAGGVGAEQALL
jgi:hypothetical protein